MTNWTNLLKGMETVELKNVTRRVVVDVPQKVIDACTQLRKPGPTGLKQQGTVEIPPNEDWVNLRAIFKAAGDRLDPPGTVTVKALYAEGDEVQVTDPKDANKTTWVPKDGAVPSFLQITVGDRRGGSKAKTQAPSNDSGAAAK